MKPAKRGPRSSAELSSIAPLVQPPAPQLHPPFPLSEDELRLWHQVLASAPRGLLIPADAITVASMVRHTAIAEALSRKLAGLEPGDAEYLAVAAAMARQSAQALSCARACRLTAHSRVPAPTAGTRARSGTAGPASLEEMRQRYSLESMQ